MFDIVLEYDRAEEEELRHIMQRYLPPCMYLSPGGMYVPTRAGPRLTKKKLLRGLEICYIRGMQQFITWHVCAKRTNAYRVAARTRKHAAAGIGSGCRDSRVRSADMLY